MDPATNIKLIVNSLLYSFVGLIILSIAFIVFDKLTPGNLWKEIVEEQNTALAIVVGAMTLGMALIIASAIHG